MLEGDTIYITLRHFQAQELSIKLHKAQKGDH